jgi:hypothetical protein
VSSSRYTFHSIKKICEKKLNIDFRSGKHFSGWVLLNGAGAARITIPKGRKSISPKLYKSMARQLELETEQFDKLLACPMTAAQYMRILKKIKQ